MEIVSDNAFRWFLTLMVGGVGVWLVFFELRNFGKLKGQPAGASRRDKQFGYAIGLVIALIAILGTLRFNHLV